MIIKKKRSEKQIVIKGKYMTTEKTVIKQKTINQREKVKIIYLAALICLLTDKVFMYWFYMPYNIDLIFEIFICYMQNVDFEQHKRSF